MAESNVTTTLPGVSRRAILAGIAALPCVAGAEGIDTPSSRTAFATAKRAYMSEKAAYSQLRELWAPASDAVEPFRAAWVAASRNKETVFEEALRRQLIFAVPNSDYLAIAEALRAGDGAVDARIERVREMIEAARKEVRKHSEVVRASEQEKAATEALEQARHSSGYYPLSDAIERAGDRVLKAMYDLELARPANLREFIEKLELLAVASPGNAYELVDFYDLAVSDLATLAGMQVELKPKMEDLPRGTCWGGLGNITNEGEA